MVDGYVLGHQDDRLVCHGDTMSGAGKLECHGMSWITLVVSGWCLGK